MQIKAQFKFEGKDYEFYRDISILDRNYDDENYALFFERPDKDEYGCFEINVYKKENKKGELFLIESGHTLYYANIHDDYPRKVIKTKISFI